MQKLFRQEYLSPLWGSLVIDFWSHALRRGLHSYAASRLPETLRRVSFRIGVRRCFAV